MHTGVCVCGLFFRLFFFFFNNALSIWAVGAAILTHNSDPPGEGWVGGGRISRQPLAREESPGAAGGGGVAGSDHSGRNKFTAAAGGTAAATEVQHSHDKNSTSRQRLEVSQRSGGEWRCSETGQ